MKTEKILGYEVHRKKVKNINLRIKENMQIYISAPENLHSDYIKNFLISKEKWIKNVLKKLEKIKEERKEKEYITGEIHNFLGQKYVLIVKLGNINRVALKSDKKNEIILTVNSDIFDNSEEKKRILEKWHFENAKKVFLELLKKWAEILNEDVKKFSVKPLSKKWGFCNYTKRYVTLNVELIKRTPFEIEYVILHELAHLKYPNHGKGFYNYVEKYMPNYRNAEKMLNAKHHY